MAGTELFVLGLDLDGTCGDFYSRMREIAAEWTGEQLADLAPEPEWDLGTWGIASGSYNRFHRFAVTQRRLFETMLPMPFAPQAIRRMAYEGIRIRIITHRLTIPHFHEVVIQQTIRWLDHWNIPYWDLCFMRDKGEVGADLYIDDAPANILSLRARDQDVIIFSNATNTDIADNPGGRVRDWLEAEEIIRQRYYAWPGSAPSGLNGSSAIGPRASGVILPVPVMRNRKSCRPPIRLPMKAATKFAIGLASDYKVPLIPPACSIRLPRCSSRRH